MLKFAKIYKIQALSGLERSIYPYFDYTAKSIEYTTYLVNRGHDLKSVQQCFNNVGKTSRQEAWKKVKPRNAKNLIVFSTSFDPHGPNVNKIINRNIHLLLNNDNLKELYPKGTILVANKREKNLQQLLMRSDSYNIKDDQQLKEDRGYTKCSYKNCDSYNNFVDGTTYIECDATGEEEKRHFMQLEKRYLCSILY